jgi:hypothetical protein
MEFAFDVRPRLEVALQQCRTVRDQVGQVFATSRESPPQGV